MKNLRLKLWLFWQLIKSRHLVKNWSQVALVHYSTNAFYVVAALVLVPEILFILTGIDLNPVIIGRWIIAAVIFGLVGKFIVQTDRGKYTRRIVIGLAVGLGLWASIPALAQADNARRDKITADLVIQWEGAHKVGRYHVSYRDIVGVWTYCYGDTEGAGPDMYFNDQQCRARLHMRLNEYRTGLYEYFTPETVSNRLTDERSAAYVSLAYNVGIRSAGRSTATRRLNKGNIAGGCEALTWWNKAGGRVVRGLVNRRRSEYAYCMAGL